MRSKYCYRDIVFPKIALGLFHPKIEFGLLHHKIALELFNYEIALELLHHKIEPKNTRSVSKTVSKI